MKSGRKNSSRGNGSSKAGTKTNKDSEHEKRMDDALIHIIQGLDLFIAQASSLQLGTIASILRHAKEDLVFWAADMNFHETRAEAFINRLLYTNSLFAAADFIEKISCPNNQERLVHSLNNIKTETPVYALIQKLRPNK